MNVPHPIDLAPDRPALLEKFMRVRQHSLRLAAPLSDEDCCVQSMPDASPVKWHLAHSTWFFETFLLEKFEPAFQPFHPTFRVLFNSYYNGVGTQHARPQRGMLTRPSLKSVRDYRRNVEERILSLLAMGGAEPHLCALLELGINHEQQHQELLLTDIKHLLSLNPLLPAYYEQSTAPSVVQTREVRKSWREFPGGIVAIGREQHLDDSFCFDNELPQHKHYLATFSLATNLVTNGEYLEFIAAGGYENPQHWLSEGWDWVNGNQLTYPFYWSNGAHGWQEFTLAGLRALDPQLPVSHLSFFEADAYARWVGARLPTEFEWEHAAQTQAVPKLAADRSSLCHPQSAAVANASELAQLFGEVWQWTTSSYAPYPGFQAPAGAVGEYNGKFMVNQYVLRGSSCATPIGHSRVSYRNFFPTSARWQFTGIRLARSL